MIDAPTATLIASALATAVAVIGFAAVVYYKIGKLEQSQVANRELTLAESRRLSDKMDADYSRLSDKMDADYSRLSDKMDSNYARLSDKMDAQHSETMSAIQRLTDAFLTHSHEADGSIIFRVPPGSGSA